MNRRRTDIPTLNIALLDVLTNALGAVLLVLIFVVTVSRAETRWHRQIHGLMQDENRRIAAQLAGVKEAAEILRLKAEAAQKTSAASQQQLENAIHDFLALKQELDTVSAKAGAAAADRDSIVKQVEKLENDARTLRAEMAGAIGLKGEMRGVVFVFDTSESMKTPRFAEYLALLKNWVAHLPFERFNVVRFDSTVEAWSDELKEGSAENRRAAAEYIDKFEPRGQTDTLGALQKALSMPGGDTVILLSDGEPYLIRDGRPALDSDGRPIYGEPAIRQVLEWLRENARGATINTVGMGNYLNAAYGKFLQDVAREHGGEFIGR